MRRWNNLSCCNLLFFAFYNFSNFNSQRFQKQKLILKGTKCNTRMTDAAEAEVSQPLCQPACLPASPSATFRKNLSGLIFISAPAFIAFPEQTSWHETDLFWFQHFENIFHLLFPLPNFHGIFWGFIIPCIALFTVYDDGLCTTQARSSFEAMYRRLIRGVVHYCNQCDQKKTPKNRQIWSHWICNQLQEMHS